MTEKTAGTVEAVQVDAASAEKVPAKAVSKPDPTPILTEIWVPGNTVRFEDLKRQAIANTRDAVPVASYDVVCERTAKEPTKAQRDNAEGRLWEMAVTYTPRTGAPAEAVDLEKVIAEAKASYGDTHPGSEDFLKTDTDK